jgi:DedD protein
MPLFNFRRGGAASSTGASASTPPDSVEAIRKRAKHRLIGASVLVLVGVVGFPLVFDTQPRPIPVDIPIDIPARNSVKPLTPPAKVSAAKSGAASPAPAIPPAAAPAATPADRVAASSSLDAREEVLGERKAAAKPEAPAEVKSPAAAAARPLAVDKGARARSLLDGAGGGAALSPVAPVAAAQASRSADASSRMVVQVGAFADVAKAREARVRLEKAGLKTYTQVAQTASGKRIRVRVGPFASRTEAEKAAGKIKSLDLPASILTL